MESTYPGSALVQAATDGHEASGSIKLFSVLDGHNGWECAEAVKHTLHPMIIASLRSLYAGGSTPTDTNAFPFASPVLSNYTASTKESLGSAEISPAVRTLLPPVEITSHSIKNALVSSFKALDDQITWLSIKVIGHELNKVGAADTDAFGKEAIVTAQAGACALNVLVDKEREELYVSNAGDCRAVAGYWMKDESGKGRWRCEV